MSLPVYKSIDVHRVYRGKINKETMEVASEYPVAFYINGALVATVAVSSADLEYFALGHLISEGIISSQEDVDSISFNEKKLQLDVWIKEENIPAVDQTPRIVTGGGRAKQQFAPLDFRRVNLPQISSHIIMNISEEFLQPSDLRKRTRGFHAAALYTLEGEKLAFFDEIGRHSALDKTIGYACKQGIALKDKIILSTGRVSSEIAGKIIYSGAPVLISRASPTHYAIELLRKYNIICICRASGEGFTVAGGIEHIDVRTSS